MFKTILPSLFVSGLVVGCASSNATSDVVAAAAVSSAPPSINAADENGTLDGVYKGRATALRQSGQCGPFRDPTLHISNNRITRRFGNYRLDALVQPDGTFRALAGRTRLSGTVRNGHINAQASNERCSYRYFLDQT